LASAELELAEKKAVMGSRLRLMDAEAEIERTEDELRAAQVDLQVAQSKLSELGALPDAAPEITESSARDITAKEETVRRIQAKIEKLRSGLDEISRSSAAEEQQLKQCYQARREALAAKAAGREGESGTGKGYISKCAGLLWPGEGNEGHGEEGNKGGRWFWPFGGGRRANGGVAEHCGSIYADAVAMVELAENAGLDKKWEVALNNYDRASLKLMELHKLWPAFRARDVSKELRKCRQGIEEAGIESGRRQYDELLAYIRERLQQDPYDAESHLSLGELYYRHGEPDKAIDEYNKAITLRADFQEAYYRLGIAYMKKGNMERASSNLGKAVSLAPQDVKACLGLGRAKRELGDYQGARTELEAAIEADPSYPPPYFLLGQIYQSVLNDRKKAVYYWEKYLKLAPEDSRAARIREWVEQNSRQQL